MTPQKWSPVLPMGVTVPEALMPLVEELIQARILLDEDGNAITALSQLRSSPRLTLPVPEVKP